MFRITAISAGMAGVEYLLHAAGCAEHDHDDTLELDKSSKGAEYLLRGNKHGEAAGVWLGNGLAMVGMASGKQVTPDDMRAIYGRLEHPETGEPLGRRPRNYATFQQRLAAAYAREPLASPERREEIRRQLKVGKRKAVGYYDLLFTSRKSESVYLAALIAAGEHGLADVVRNAHIEAVCEALSFLEAAVTTTRVGRHSSVPMADGTRRTVGKYEQITGMIMTLWNHSSSREGDPHLHTHVAALNRVMTVAKKIYALDAQQFKALKGAADMIYERRMEQLVTEGTGARYAWRADGTTREILGIDPVLCQDSSVRAGAIQERLNAMVEEYRTEHGHEPGRQAMAAMRHLAWAESRKAKTGMTPEQIADQYADKHGKQHLADQVRQVAEAAARVAEEGLPAGQPKFATEDAMLAEAVKRTQALHATWDETALALEINKLLGDVRWDKGTAAEEVSRLVRRAVAPDGPGNAMALTPKDRVEVPKELRQGGRENGEPIYRVASTARYCTREQIGAEKQLVAETQTVAGPRLGEERQAEVRAELDRRKLSVDQARAVMGILTSGKAADVLIGPAGTGKSTTVGEIDRVWREEFDAPVLGLATSQRATEVLREEGLDALNTAMFLAHYMPDDGSQPKRVLAPGTLVVVDEAGMADTDKLARIAALVRKAGGKLLYTGDQQQLAAVGTGGMLRLLSLDSTPFELEQVWRFRAEWERAASLKFRVGDTTALAQYEERGRLRAGTKEEMVEAAVRGYMADVVQGRDSVLIVRTNEDAATLSGRVRDELKALGRVGAQDIARLRDGTFCGVGDLVQARQIDRKVVSEDGRMLVNREVLRVRGRDQHGRLVLERTDGTAVWVTKEYVDRHLTLAYAGTVHSVQGRTTDTSHSVVERGTSCNSVYVQVTRGRDGNYIYGVCEVPADAHQLDTHTGSVAELVAEILDVDGGQVSATEAWRAELEAADSLAQIGALWSLVALDAMAKVHHTAVEAAVGEGRKLAGDKAYQPLMALLAHAELTGHDVKKLVADAAGTRSFDNATSACATLQWRIERKLEAEGELTVQGSWAKRMRSDASPAGQYAKDLAKLMDDRLRIMSRAAVLIPPSWAERDLGPMPPNSRHYARQRWAARVTAVQSYREMYDVGGDGGIGPAPSLYDDPVRHVAWHRAWEALGRPEEISDQARQTDDELRADVARWEREQQWAPAYVAGDMEKALILAEENRREVALRKEYLRAELAANGGVSTDEAKHLRQAVAVAERQADRHGQAAARYERLHDARVRWAERTAGIAERAQLAADELGRRNPAVPEQVPLLDADGGLDTQYAQEAAAAYERCALQPEELRPHEHAKAVPLDWAERVRHFVQEAPEPAMEPALVADVEVVDAEVISEVKFPEVEQPVPDGPVLEAELVEPEAVVAVPVVEAASVPEWMDVSWATEVDDLLADASPAGEVEPLVDVVVDPGEVEAEAEAVAVEPEPEPEASAAPEVADAELQSACAGWAQRVRELLDVEDDAQAAADAQADSAAWAEQVRELLEEHDVDAGDQEATAAPEDDVEVVDAEVVEAEEVDADATADADAETSADVEEEAAEVRGDYGTQYVLDELPEADAAFPAPEEPEAGQLELFEADEPDVAVRLTAGWLTDADFTLGDAEERDELRRQIEQARARREELEAKRARAEAEAEEERRQREERERADEQAEAEAKEREAREREKDRERDGDDQQFELF